MLTLCEVLKKNGIPELCKYITGIRNKHYIQKKEARLSRQQLYMDPMYNHLISTKYRSIKSMIEKKKNFIESNILLLTTNEYTYNTLDSSLNGKVIIRNDEEIRRGVLSFFQNIIY
jgi:16S rRNA G966 N2-methylase RsmD